MSERRVKMIDGPDPTEYGKLGKLLHLDDDGGALVQFDGEEGPRLLDACRLQYQDDGSEVDPQ